MELVQGNGDEVVGDWSRPGADDDALHLKLWHAPLRALLAGHIPLLLAFALVGDVDPITAVAFLLGPAALVVGAGTVGGAGAQAAMVAVGLAWSSWLLVWWSGGAVEAQFHGLVVIALVGLYRDRVALALISVGVLALHLGPGLLRPELVHDHPAALTDPLIWTLVSVLAIAAVVAVVLLTWHGGRAAEAAVVDDTGSWEREAGQLRHQQELAAVYAAAARRSQGLLERQLQIIEQMEAEEADPATLQQLFVLDHLSTRMNRGAASMLVLAGGEPTRRVTGTPPLSEVVRGAVGEIEDYTRVKLALADDRAVDGHRVAALVHVLSELVENAATFSPPAELVHVMGGTTADGGYRLRIIDRGIGLDDARLEEYNHLLTNPPAVPPSDNQRLGLDVVARLAGRLALPVQLSHNTDGRGVTASVHVPAHFMSPAPADVVAAAEDADPMATPIPAAAATVNPVEGGVPSPGTVGTATPAASTTGSGSPRWASATGRAGSSGGTPAPAPLPEVGAPLPVARRSSPSRPAAIHATAQSASSWSYSGHLDRRPDPTASAGEDDARPGRFGRGSRSQVAGIAPRGPEVATPATPVKAAPADPAEPGAGWPTGDATSQRPTPGGRSTIGGRQQGSLPPRPSQTQAAPRATGGQPPTPGAPGWTSPVAAPTPAAQPWGPAAEEVAPSSGASRPAAARLVAERLAAERLAAELAAERLAAERLAAERVAVERDAVERDAARRDGAERPAAGESQPRSRPTPAELLEGIGETPTHGEWDLHPAPHTAVPPPAGIPAAASSAAAVPGAVEDSLPQRHRGASLPIGLRGDAEASVTRSASADPVSREESRSLLSSYQSRLQAGRRAAEDQVARNRAKIAAVEELETQPTSSPETSSSDETP